MAWLYEHFVVYRNILISIYWRKAWTMHINLKNNGSMWMKCSLLTTMKYFENKVLSGIHFVNARDIDCSYLCNALKKPDSMTLKASKACSEIIVKLCELIKIDFVLTIGVKESSHLFTNFATAASKRVLQNVTETYQLLLPNLSHYIQVLLQTVHIWWCRTMLDTRNRLLQGEPFEKNWPQSKQVQHINYYCIFWPMDVIVFGNPAKTIWNHSEFWKPGSPWVIPPITLTTTDAIIIAPTQCNYHGSKHCYCK